MANATLDPVLADLIETAAPDDVLDVDIFLRSEPAQNAALDGKIADAEPALARIRRDADAAQRELLAYLEQTRAAQLALDSRAPAVEVVDRFWANNAISARITAGVLQALLMRNDVLYVQPAHRASLSDLIDSVPSADGGVPRLDEPWWSVTRVGAPKMWSRGYTGEGVVVAVVDTGVNYEHADLASHMWQSERHPHHGWNFAEGNDDPMDLNAHGTACAGIVAGDGRSGIKAGVAPGSRVMAIRVGGEERQFWRGLQFAMDNGAHVVSMSMTWKYPAKPNYPGWRRFCETLLASRICHAN